ncbi:MAG TPA: pyruvate, phosphate dikinase [Acidimicrobiia bacterium]
MNLPHLYDFSTGDGSDKDLLGGKGAGLARMTSLGLPVPPGFTITTDACRATMSTGEVPESLWEEVDAAVARLEAATGRTFGTGPVPLLLSVRSGAKFSMPGMMDTVLNLGINDEVVKSLIEWSGDPHFAWDVTRRFLQMYGDVVLGVDEKLFQDVLSDLRIRRTVEDDSELITEDLEAAARQFREIIERESPERLPDEPMDQLRGAITAVFKSWNTKRAKDYRRIHHIPDDLGTAANVQMMVFGDLGDDSGTGVCFTRDPGTGDKVLYGDYLPRAQGEDVVAGIRNTLTLNELAGLHPECHGQLIQIMSGLESHYRDMCDIEFTIERNVLYILQTRAGKRTAAAAVKMAVAMVKEGLIDRETAITRVEPSSIEQLHRPRVANSVKASSAIASGVAASPGAATGKVVFSSEDAVEEARHGAEVILVRPETTPDDIHGMDASVGILTSQGGKTSHAAVVARGMGKPAVTGAADLLVDARAGIASTDTFDIRAGDVITIDGTKGLVFAGEVELVAPDVPPQLGDLLQWADEFRQIGVWANADTAQDATLARSRGAEGIGLARTEHMFLGRRLAIVQRVILSTDPAERERALVELELQQVGDFESLLEAMDGLPVIIRLLDPPLHEFLPSRLELEHEMLRRVRAGQPIDDLQAMSDQVARWEEDNPMLGLRGVRLGLMLKDLYRMQARAATTALTRRIQAGGDPHLEIMIPLVAATEELVRMREMIEAEIALATGSSGVELPIPIGTMIELPRAALIAGEIARVADFFSFGTNDLTQMTYGLSRDDAEGLFLRDYLEQGILTSDPFQSIDRAGVGRLIRVATREGREANPGLMVGLCGEHGGDPDSIEFVHGLGLDYVSCSPPRVEGARLAAAQAALGDSSSANGVD